MENAIRSIVAFIILGIVIYIGVQVVPIYMDHWNLEDEIKEKLQYAFVSGSGDVEKRLKKEISTLLKDMGAIYEQKDVQVKREGSRKLSVDIWYARSHKLPVLQNPKQFHLHLENKVVEGL